MAKSWACTIVTPFEMIKAVLKELKVRSKETFRDVSHMSHRWVHMFRELFAHVSRCFASVTHNTYYIPGGRDLAGI